MIASSRSGKGRLLFCRRAAPIGKLTLPQSTRSGQDRSLRTAAHGCLVGRGLDPSGQPGGGRRAVGAGHARPAALKRLPVKGWPRRPPGRACPAPTGKLTLPQSTRSGQDRSLQTAAHGRLVGRGLDPSGQPGGGRRAVGAGHARPAALKRLPVKGWPRRPPGRACPAPTKSLPPRQNGARFSAGPVLVGIGK